MNKNDPRLTAYALGELPAKEAKDVEQILKSSPEARQIVREIQQQSKDLRAAFLTEALPAPAKPVMAGSKWMLYSSAVAFIAVAIWFLLPTGHSGEGVQRKAKVILDPPPPPVSVNGEMAGIQMDLDGKMASASPAMDVLLLKSVFQAHANEVQECYATNRPEKPEGGITIVFEIDPQGQVLDAVIPKTDFKSVRLAACLTERILRWTFSKPKVVTKVMYPIRFYH